MGLVPNRPSPEGRKAGSLLAKMADAAEDRLLERFPDGRRRCGTCAFRGGTIPNGCAATVMDALKSVIEFREFLCHEKPAHQDPEQICAGWLAAISSLGPDARAGEAPWDWSISEEDEASLA